MEQQIQLFRQIQILERQADGTFRVVNETDPESEPLQLQINRWLKETGLRIMAAPSPTSNSYWLDKDMTRRFTSLVLTITYFQSAPTQVSDTIRLVEPGEADKPLTPNDRVVRIQGYEPGAGEQRIVLTD